MDHAQLVHSQWLHIAELQIEVWIQRVGTHDNVADLPSRNDLSVLRAIGATSVEPCLKDIYTKTKSWDLLSWR
eukprot:6158648-Karenia_brevis.AAC.1